MSQRQKLLLGKGKRLRLYASIYALVVLGWYVTYAIRVGTPNFPIGGPGDFASFYAAGQIITEGKASHLYSLQLQSDTQQELLAANGALSAQSVFLPFAYPPFFALLFVPLTYVGLLWAYHLWYVVNLCLLLVSVWLLWSRRETDARGDYPLASLLALSFVPVLAAFYNGQSSFVLFFAMTVALLALKVKRDWLAGAALAMGLVKPQLIPLLVIVLLYERVWRTLLAFFVAGVGLLAVSAAVVGIEGLEGYVNVLRAGSAWGGTFGMNPALMSNLRGAVYLLGEILNTWTAIRVSSTLLQGITVLLTLVVVLFTLHAWRDFGSRQFPRFELLVMLTLSGALVMSPHLYIQDLTLLIVGALLLAWGGLPRNGPALPLHAVGAGHIALFVALFLLPGPARAQVAALLLVAVMVVSYIELRRGNSKHTGYP